MYISTLVESQSAMHCLVSLHAFSSALYCYGKLWKIVENLAPSERLGCGFVLVVLGCGDRRAIMCLAQSKSLSRALADVLEWSVHLILRPVCWSVVRTSRPSAGVLERGPYIAAGHVHHRVVFRY